MRVKSLMVLGKLCLILACSNSYAQSWSGPVNRDRIKNDSFLAFAYNMSIFYGSRLGKFDNAMHTQAVYHALNSLDNGESVEWYNDRNNSHGKARIVYTIPGGGTICRRIHSWVQIGNSSNNFEDTACYNNNTNTWTFVDKY
jgi:surface antigen